MAQNLRVRCSCGEVADIFPGYICARCRQPIVVPQGGMLNLYRKPAVLGFAVGYGVYLNELPYGYVGMGEVARIPLPFGEYKLHIAATTNRKCTDMIITLTPDSPMVNLSVQLKMGAFVNKFILEPIAYEELPQN